MEVPNNKNYNNPQTRGSSQYKDFRGDRTCFNVTNIGKSCPSGRMHAREWSYDRTVAGRGSLPSPVYHTFTPFPVGVTEGSIYSATGGARTGHNDKTKLPGKMLLPSGRSGYTTVTFGGHSAVIPEYTGGQLPGLVPKVPGEPAVIGPCVETSMATSTQWSLQGSVQLVLAARYYSGGQTSASEILPSPVLAVV